MNNIDWAIIGSIVLPFVGSLVGGWFGGWIYNKRHKAFRKPPSRQATRGYNPLPDPMPPRPKRASVGPPRKRKG